MKPLDDLLANEMDVNTLKAKLSISIAKTAQLVEEVIEVKSDKKEILEALIGLRRDFGEVLGEYDIEPSMAGYMDVALEVILKYNK